MSTEYKVQNVLEEEMFTYKLQLITFKRTHGNPTIFCVHPVQ